VDFSPEFPAPSFASAPLWHGHIPSSLRDEKWIANCLFQALLMEVAVSAPQATGEGRCLQLVQTWPSSGNIALRRSWARYTSTLMMTWLRLDSLNISNDFLLLLLRVRVTRNNGMLLVCLSPWGRGAVRPQLPGNDNTKP
jgi:hypothetical protein